MNPPYLNLDTKPFYEELRRFVSLHSPNVLNSLPKLPSDLFRIEGPIAISASEYRFSLHVSDRLREWLLTVRAGKINGIIEGISHG